MSHRSAQLLDAARRHLDAGDVSAAQGDLKSAMSLRCTDPGVVEDIRLLLQRLSLCAAPAPTDHASIHALVDTVSTRTVDICARLGALDELVAVLSQDPQTALRIAGDLCRSGAAVQLWAAFVDAVISSDVSDGSDKFKLKMAKMITSLVTHTPATARLIRRGLVPADLAALIVQAVKSMALATMVIHLVGLLLSIDDSTPPETAAVSDDVASLVPLQLAFLASIASMLSSNDADVDQARLVAYQALLRMLQTQTVDHPELAVALSASQEAMSALLAACDPDGSPAHSSALSPSTSDQNVTATARLALNRIFSLLPSTSKDTPARTGATEVVHKIICGWIQSEKIANRKHGYRALAALFAADPEAARKIFTTSGFLDEVADDLDFEPSQVHCAILEVLNAACSYQGGRALVEKHAKTWINSLAMQQSSDPDMAASARIILAKLQHNVGDDLASMTKAETADSRASLEQVAAILKLPVAASSWSCKTSAVEGLAYLTLTPTTRVAVANDMELAKALVELSKALPMSDGQQIGGLAYGLASVLDNLTHFPPRLSEHEKQVRALNRMASVARANQLQGLSAEQKKQLMERDKEIEPEADVPAVCLRVNALMDAGVMDGVASLIKCHSKCSEGESSPSSKSKSSDPLLKSCTAVLANLTTHPSHRGRFVQGGGVSIVLALLRKPELDDDMRSCCIYSLSRLAVSLNPRLAFPGTQAASLVRPLTEHLDVRSDPNHQLEALMALTNLASTGPDIQPAMLRSEKNRPGVVEQTESLLVSQHSEIRRAATELMCNLATIPEVVARFESDVERVKLLGALADTDDVATRLAASGALAILCGSSDVVCDHVVQTRACDVIVELLEDAVAGVRHRAAECMRCLIAAGTDVARRAMARDDALRGLVSIVARGSAEGDGEPGRETAIECLQMLEECGGRVLGQTSL